MKTRTKKLAEILGTAFPKDPVALRVVHEAVERDVVRESAKDRSELIATHRAEIAALKGAFNAELGAMMAQFHVKLMEVHTGAVREALSNVLPLAVRADELEQKLLSFEAMSTTRNSKSGAELERLRKNMSGLKEQFAMFAVGAPNRSFYMNGALPSAYFSDTNLIAGTGIELVASTDFESATAGITINSTGGSFTLLAATGSVNGVNATFGFAQEPAIIVSDGAWYTQLDNNGGTQWTWNAGTMQATMVIPPQSSIFGVA